MKTIFNKKIFSENLIYYMKKNDKKQMDLVNDLGFTKSTISSWCTGSRIPRMDKLDVLANYFGIEISNLIEVKSENEDLLKIFENIKTLLKTKDNLMLDGKPISKKNCNLVLDAIQVVLELARTKIE